MANTRAVTPEEIVAFRKQGHEVAEGSVVNLDTGDIEQAASPAPAPENQGSSNYSAWGTVPRQLAGNALPIAAGGFTTAMLAAAPFTEGASLIPLGVGMGVTALSKYLQDKGLKSVAERNPKGMIADFVAGSEYDVKEHPYLSAASALPGSGLVKGGSFIPRITSALANPKTAAKLGAINVGADVGMQMYGNKSFDPTLLDPKMLGISALGSTFVNPTTALATGSARPVGAPTQAHPSMGHTGPITDINAPENWHMKYPARDIAAMTPDQIRLQAAAPGGEGQRWAAIDLLQNNGIDITPEVTQRIGSPGGKGPRAVAYDIIAESKVPGSADRMETAKSAAEKNQEELSKRIATEPEGYGRKATIPPAEESGAVIAAAKEAEEVAAKATNEAAYQDRLQAAKNAGDVSQIKPAPSRITTITEKGIEQPPSTGEAEASARAMGAQPDKNLDVLQKELNYHKAAAKKMMKRASELEESGNEEEALRHMSLAKFRVDQAQEAYDAAARENTANRISPEEAAKMRSSNKPDEGTDTGPTEPDTGPKPPLVTPPEPEITPVATKLEKKKSDLGIQVTPGQKPKEVGPVQDLKDALASKKPYTQGAKKLVASHPALQNLTDEALIPAFEKLSPADRIKLADLYLKGAESWPTGKITGAAEELIKKKERIPKIIGPKGPQTTAVEKENLPKKAVSPAKVEAGSVEQKVIPKEPESRGFGITPDVVKTATSKIHHEIKATTQRIADTLGSVGKHFAKKYEDMRIGKRAMEETSQHRITQLEKQVNENSANKIGKHLIEMSNTGKSKVSLTPDERTVADAIRRDIIKTTASDKARPDSPLVQAIDETGKTVERPFEERAHWYPSIIKKEVLDILNKGKGYSEATYNKLRDDYIAHHMEMTGSNRETADKAFANRMSPVIGKHAPNPEFRNLRLEEGIGLPESWQETNVFKTARSLISRHTTDMAYHRYLESDPIIAKGLNLHDNGRGEAIPENVKTKEGKEVNYGDLSSDDVKAALNDYVGGTGGHEFQKAEKFQGLIHTAKIGPVSQLRNFVQNNAALQELLLPEERVYMANAAKDMFRKEAYETAMKAGSVRHRRNIAATVAHDAESKIATLTDILGKYSGNEMISKANDVYLDSIGRNVAKNRLASGDKAFIDEFGPDNWKEKPLDEVVDHIAAKFQRRFSGAYDATDLPPSLLRGSTLNLAPMLKLSRWSVGRFNNWKKDVYDKAADGDIKPLLRSLGGAMIGAGVINTLSEAITGRKPKELTWSEYLKLGGKEHAYMLFSKAATASYGGILSDAAFGAIQLANGEMPRSLNNLAFQSLSDAITRVAQFGGAVADGNAEIGDLTKLALEIGKDNVQVLRLFDRPEDVGKREEKIAGRLGYIPKKGTFTKSLTNPFGEAEAYRNEDSEQLGKILSNKIEHGIRPAAPDSEIRKTGRMTEKGYKTYYDYIRESQGEEAAQKALDRDIENTTKKKSLFGKALSERK